MPIVATAGHVDHGKSTLVQALTGRDPDRWAEEKERGLTIDLGFAWTEIDGLSVGFVDVPGHERFIKNMLAGMGALDVALLVVAADEGWMPQTEEHVAVLDGLGVEHGVVALSRIDLVDDELVELAAAEVLERTAGTTLQGWPVLPVAAPLGSGVAELRHSLATVLAKAGPAADMGRPRMWIDRAFVVGGAGLVVTGTLVDGSLEVGAEVQLWPAAALGRVRGLQSHEAAVERISPGNRTAVNLAGLDRSAALRGTMLAAPGTFRTSRRLLADLSSVRAWPGAVTDRGAYHLHAGTGHWPVSIRLQGARRLEGRNAALVRLAEPVPLRMGDRFVIREVGRRAVVAGGTVLDPAPGSGHIDGDAVAALRRTSSADEAAASLLAIRGTATLDDLAADTGGGRPQAAVAAGGLVMTERWIAATLERLRADVAAFHETNPLRPGMPKATLASQHGLTGGVLDAVVATPDSGLVSEADAVRASTFSPSWPAELEQRWQKAEAQLRADGLAVPRTSALGLDDEALHAVVRTGRLRVIAPDVAYLPDQVEEIITRLSSLPDGFTVSQFRDAMGVSRRHAVPLLEWLDTQGYTSRRGDVRTVRRRPAPIGDDAPTP